MFKRETLAFKNAKIITPMRVIGNGVLIVENGKISSIGPETEVKIPQGIKLIDATDNYLAPGFIDIHLHGAGGADTMDGTEEAIEKISKVHARGGSTCIVPTTLTAPLDRILKAVSNIGIAKRKTLKGAQVLGAHIEGPYLSVEQGGAQNAKYLKVPRPEEYEKLLEFSEDICQMTVAPELDGALELGKALVREKIVASIGHSNATYDEVVSAIEAGFSHVTHIFSGMSGLRRINLFRVAGVIESTLLLDELTTEMIADGRHIPASLMKLVIKAKGLDKVSLVTDASSSTGMPEGQYRMGGLEVIVKDGVAKLSDGSGFAGSVATMNLCVRNMIELVGLSMQDAVKMATLNPAKIIGVDKRKGSLVEGKDADLVIFDKDINILATVVEGKVVFSCTSLNTYQP
jgi:N-acetylglucosamine-6-phosphate deacetylase